NCVLGSWTRSTIALTAANRPTRFSHLSRARLGAASRRSVAMNKTAPCVLLALGLARAVPSDACCVAFPQGAMVQIADQSVIITWNEDTKTEHFIRRAAFRTTQENFGFLVPTPTQPQLAEAPDAAFARFADAIKPEERNVYSFVLRSLLFWPASKGAR